MDSLTILPSSIHTERGRDALLGNAGVPALYPSQHRRCLHTNNPLERIMKEIRRRTRVIGAFPDGKSALMLACARLRFVANSKWGEKRYLDMKRLYEQEAAENEERKRPPDRNTKEL